MNKIKRYIFCILSIVLMIFADQYTKHLAVVKLKGHSAYKLIPNVLHFEYLTNNGAAWGMMSEKQTMFIIVTSIILVVIAYVYIRTPETKKYLPFRIVLTMLFSGAIGNFIDRVANGYVHDFIYFVPIDFPVFNVADCYITISAVLLILLVLFKYKEDDDFDFLKLKK